ncbi:GNAT family N-acetyltransferase [Marinicella gelatinilytica]|uniref:GNAT family N-acetyltransferase n=1 Tax=Marinicella gelatinilytica TaxID=2996017 RepID=UPI0022609B4B|nr:GNAT family N-acetyltransferase [Marinicella gelatinilytica]MCX7545581.1 GNAT family N-acetyltransferase [Marinicella gelatinilytica]
MRGLIRHGKKFVDIEFRQYHINEPCYLTAWVLREQVLRAPLGLSLTAKDRHIDQNCWHFGLFKNNQIIATVTIEPQDVANDKPQHVKLRQMVVSPDFQNQGLGQKLIKNTEQALHEKSVTSIILAARLPAVKFYQKLGYKPQGSVYHHLRIDHRDMLKNLD